MSTKTVYSPSTVTSRTNTNTATRTLTATGAAVAGNTLIWAAGRIGEPIRVVIGSDAAPEPLAWAHVAITTIVATVVGGAVLALVRRYGRSDRVWAAGAIGLAVVSAVPLWRLDIDATSKSLLTLMHLLTGVCCVTAHLARQHASAQRASVAVAP
jgi:Family of unknown function (DUF6069)